MSHREPLPAGYRLTGVRHAMQTLREIREDCDIKQSDLAKQVHIMGSHLSKLENGSNPNTSTFFALAEALELQVALIPKGGAPCQSLARVKNL